MWDAHYGLGEWAWIWMAAMMLVVWAPLGLLGLWAVRQAGQTSDFESTGKNEPDAAEIAGRSYARGEIGRDRFLEVMSDLEKETHSTTR